MDKSQHMARSDNECARLCQPTIWQWKWMKDQRFIVRMGLEGNEANDDDDDDDDDDYDDDDDDDDAKYKGVRKPPSCACSRLCQPTIWPSERVVMSQFFAAFL